VDQLTLDENLKKVFEFFSEKVPEKSRSLFVSQRFFPPLLSRCVFVTRKKCHISLCLCLSYFCKLFCEHVFDVFCLFCLFFRCLKSWCGPMIYSDKNWFWRKEMRIPTPWHSPLFGQSDFYSTRNRFLTIFSNFFLI